LTALAETPRNLDDVDHAAARLRLSRAMVYRLLAKFIRAPSALLPSRRGRKTGRHVLGPEIEQVVAHIIRSYYLMAERPKVAQLCHVVQAECRKLQLPHRLTKPSPVAFGKSILRRLFELERAKKQLAAAIEWLEPVYGHGCLWNWSRSITLSWMLSWSMNSKDTPLAALGSL
jgi:hypothetical protein